MLEFVKSIYYSKYFPRVFFVKNDGGVDSGVIGFMLIEWKILFSIGFLYFRKGSREAYHSHAFNAVTWWLFGSVTEVKFLGRKKNFYPSFIPKFTKRDNIHKVIAHSPTVALTFRGPWRDSWHEIKNGKMYVLTHSRKVIKETPISSGI